MKTVRIELWNSGCDTAVRVFEHVNPDSFDGETENSHLGFSFVSGNQKIACIGFNVLILEE